MNGLLLTTICQICAFLLALLLAWRDLRTRQLPDRELALFTLFTLLPHLLADRSLVCGVWPLWAVQLRNLLRTTGGGLFLLALAAPAPLLGGRRLVGMGDVLFALSAGFMLPVGRSVPMVVLAFILAFPFSLFQALVQKKTDPLPFIPFLAASTFMLRWLVLDLHFF